MIILWPFHVLVAMANALPEIVASFIWILGLDICLAWLMMLTARLWHVVKP